MTVSENGIYHYIKLIYSALTDEQTKHGPNTHYFTHIMVENHNFSGDVIGLQSELEVDWPSPYT